MNNTNTTNGFKLIRGSLENPIDWTRDAIARAIGGGGNLALYGFASEADAEAFAAKFPKSARVKTIRCFGFVNCDYGIHAVRGTAHGVGMFISNINGSTGIANETATRRIRQFCDTLAAEGFITE